MPRQLTIHTHGLGGLPWGILLGISVCCHALLPAADLFKPDEFGWKDIDASGPYSGVFANRHQAVAWSQDRSLFRTSTDGGSSWSASVTPTLSNRLSDPPVQGLATANAIYVLGASGYIYDNVGAPCNAAWKLPQVSRLAVTSNDLLACEEGTGLKTYLLRNGAIVQRMPGRIVFAFDGGVVTHDGQLTYASDGAEVRQIDAHPLSRMPESLPLASGPGGPVMRSTSGSMWTYRSSGLTEGPAPAPGIRILSYGYGDNGSGGVGCALLEKTADGLPYQTISAIKPPTFKLFVDEGAPHGLVFHGAAVASAGRDDRGWRYILAGQEGLKVGRIAAAPENE